MPTSGKPQAQPRSTTIKMLHQNRSLALLWVTACTFMFTAVINSTQSLSQQKFVLEKVATSLAQPIGITWLLVLATIAKSIQQRTFQQTLNLTFIFVLTTLCSSQYFGRGILRTLEADFLSSHQQKLSDLDTIVVLGGGTSTIEDTSIAQLSSSGDRILAAARAYTSRHADLIVCTGNGQGDQARALLSELGIPAAKILTVHGVNTHEEFQHLKKIPSMGRIGLVTSAWHMKRALRLASDNSIQCQPIPCDFASTTRSGHFVLDLLPTAKGLELSSRAIKEYYARVVDR